MTRGWRGDARRGVNARILYVAETSANVSAEKRMRRLSGRGPASDWTAVTRSWSLLERTADDTQLNKRNRTLDAAHETNSDGSLGDDVTDTVLKRQPWPLYDPGGI